MCNFCINFSSLKFEEEYKELISMTENYDNTLEENIYDEIYLFKPKFTSKIFLTHLTSIFSHELFTRLQVSYCPKCGRKLENEYFIQQQLPV